MNVSKIELIYNPKQDHVLYTPVILTASLLSKDNQSIIIRSCDNKIQNLNSSVDLLIDSKPLSQHLKPFSICQLLVQLINKQTDLYLSADSFQINLLIDLIDKNQSLNDLVNNLDSQLINKKYLVGSNLTLADLFLWSKLAYLEDCVQIDKLDRIKKWFKKVENDLKNALHLLTLYKPKIIINQSKQNKQLKEKKKNTTGINEEAKYVDLPGAEHGKVIVRFPPEASGYLHIGHAKAALLNQYYQVKFDGKLVFRFDDTNPEKEKEDFEEVIREDVAMLQIKPDICSYTSDYFDLYLEKCEYLIKEGKAYCDDTEPEQMKKEREERVESKNRNNSVEKNLEMWNEMKAGTEFGQKCCVRAKIDMKSDNGCLRDPALYRCKNAPHPKTGTKYKVYPTYDFACPIVDSIEGVTHSLRTTEYMDRDTQFFWIIDALKLRKPYIYGYSRLNMTHVVLSKRKLTWFVQNNLVSGWDDPRMPTVRGILRRGLTVDGLREFIIAQGSSRSIVFMEWDKIWNFNRKMIDPKSIRYMGIEKANSVRVNVSNLDLSEIEVVCHPKNPDLGKRKMKVSNRLLIDQIDAAEIKEGQFVTFMNIGNVFIEKVVKDKNIVKEINGKFEPNNKDFKNTIKVVWLDSSNVIDAHCYYYENLITKPVLDKDDEFKDFINNESEIKVDFLVEKELSNLNKSDIIQILKRGYFICDQSYDKKALTHTSLDSKVVLFSIPDGTTDLAIYPTIVQEAKKRLRDKVAQFAAAKSTKDQKQKPTQSSNSEVDLFNQITKQGDKLRELKSKCKDKKELQEDIDELLRLKTEYKKLTGKDYVASSAPAQEKKPVQQSPQQPTQSSNSEVDLFNQITKQGDKLRELKSRCKDKKELQGDIDELLRLKTEYKKLTGKDYVASSAPAQAKKPVQQSPQQPTQSSNTEVDLFNQITKQGDKLRELKSRCKDKKELQGDIDELLRLKTEYKKLTGKDYVASSAPAQAKKPVQQSPQQPTQSSNTEVDLFNQITKQGDKLRELKSRCKDKKELQGDIDELLRLKTEYKRLTGKDYVASSAPAQVKKPASVQQEKSKKDKIVQPPKQQSNENQLKKKQTLLGIENKKSENFSEWYTEVILKSEMIDYYDISGCYVLWEWSFGIWEKIQSYLNDKIIKEGVKNVGFPLFVSKNSLEIEKTHITDFAPEVAWVTKSGESDLKEPIAIRPTSETVMYPYFAKRIKSHRDLPLKVNQWNNVVRWEFKDPTPFIRTREFYWQEGHTAHATSEEALAEVYRILDHYASVYEYLLSIPMIKGKKTNKEKFAGGDMTTTIEGYISENGRGIQAATSHYLGQNFSKMFNICYQDERISKEKQFAYQNSWGFTTRSIGVMVMEHSDDKGLVLPPRVAPIQVIIIPCGLKVNSTEEERKRLLDAAKKLQNDLLDINLKVELDASDHQSVGWKFSQYELKGVPIRIEIGFKDLDKNEFIAVRRDTFEKKQMKILDVKESISKLLDDIQSNLFETAKKKRDSKLKLVNSMNEFNEQLNNKCLILAAFCATDNCEEQIKKDTVSKDESTGFSLMGAKSLCIPFKPEELVNGIKKLDNNSKCINNKCNLKAECYTLFGRSY